MKRIQTGSGAAALPAYGSSNLTKYFSDSNPTALNAEWFNIVTEELINILDINGVSPSASLDHQLKAVLWGASAIKASTTNYIANTTYRTHAIVASSTATAGDTGGAASCCIVAGAKRSKSNGSQSAILSSDFSQASGSQSSVISSLGLSAYKILASGSQSAIISCATVSTYTLTASGDRSAIIASRASNANLSLSGDSSAIIACEGATTVTGDRCTAMSSSIMTLGGTDNVCIASHTASLSGSCSASIASSGSNISSDKSSTLSSSNSDIDANYCASIASDSADISGTGALNCLNGAVDGTDISGSSSCSFILGSTDSEIKNISDTSSIISSEHCEIDTKNHSVIIGSTHVKAKYSDTVCGGKGSSPASTANRKWEINSSTGTINVSGTVNPSHGFTDYAEMFENIKIEEISLGTIVTCEGAKVRPARENDLVIGVVSATASIIGNSAALTHHSKVVSGDFGEVIRDEDGNPIKNPDYDFEKGENYIPRSDRRDEWSIVGIMGVVKVRVDKDVKEHSYVKPGKKAGIGSHSENKENIMCLNIHKKFDSKKGYAIANCLLR